MCIVCNIHKCVCIFFSIKKVDQTKASNIQHTTSMSFLQRIREKNILQQAAEATEWQSFRRCGMIGFGVVSAVVGLALLALGVPSREKLQQVEQIQHSRFVQARQEFEQRKKREIAYMKEEEQMGKR